MTCDEVERDEIAEEYVLGRLDEDRQAAFEDHYFDCAACLALVQGVQEARAQLAVQEPDSRRRHWRRAAAVLAAAAVIILAVRVGQHTWSGRNLEAPPSTASPRGDVALPAPPLPIELPPYSPPRLRAVPTEAQRVFRAAMTSYSTGDCASAMPGLQRALAIDETFAQARFYLGVCELHDGRVDAASADLQRVIAVGESPYLEDAHFFLAHARLRQGDGDGARREFQRVIELRGERGIEAKRLLEQLEPAGRRD